MKNSREITQRSKNGTTIQFNSISWYLLVENKSTNSKRHLYPYFITAYLQEPRYESNLHINQQVNGKRWYTHNEILLRHKKEKWNPAICANMDGLRVYYAKWNKFDRKWQIPYDFTYMWNLKAKTDLQIQRTNLWLPEGRGVEMGQIGEGDWEVQTSSYKISKSQDAMYRQYREKR